MKFAKIQAAALASETFVMASNASLGTWLRLHMHCSVTENGGRIAGAGCWKPKMWRTLGVERKELERAIKEGLAEWGDDDMSTLVVIGYDTVGEAAHARRREGGRRGGQAKAKDPSSMLASTASPDPASSATTHPIPLHTTPDQDHSIPADPCSADEPGNWGSLARDLIDAYPHRVDDDGIEDRPSEYELEIELATAYGDESRKGTGWSPGGFGEAMVSAAVELAKVRTGKGRKTGKGLKGWIRAKGWTVPVTRAQGQGESTGSAMARSERERLERRRLNDEARGLAPIGDSIRDLENRSTG